MISYPVIFTRITRLLRQSTARNDTETGFLLERRTASQYRDSRIDTHKYVSCERVSRRFVSRFNQFSLAQFFVRPYFYQGGSSMNIHEIPILPASPGLSDSLKDERQKAPESLRRLN
jgi:hypothetical protein